MNAPAFKTYVAEASCQQDAGVPYNAKILITKHYYFAQWEIFAPNIYVKIISYYEERNFFHFSGK